MINLIIKHPIILVSWNVQTLLTEDSELMLILLERDIEDKELLSLTSYTI